MKYHIMRNRETGRRYILVNEKKGDVRRVYADENPTEFERLRKLAIKNLRAAQKDEMMRSLGLTKVKGAVSGRTYWE